MSKKLVVVVCFTALVVHVHATASEVLMQCDVGGCGPVQAGWTGIAECGTTVDVNSTGIDVTLATGYPAACACRDTGGSGPLADVEADFLFADDAVSTPGGDFIITFSNLIAGERYWLLSYHNRSSEELSHIEGVVVTGAGDVTKPDRIAQDHPIMDDPAEVIFVAGPGDVSVRYIAPTEAEAGRGAQAFLNGFVLERMRLVAQFESSSSGDPESIVWAQLVVTLSTAQSEQVTVDYEVTGGTAEGNSVDYEIAPGPVVFEAGQTVRFIDIFIVEDGIDEEDETIEVTLTGVSDSNVGLGLRAGHTYTIIDPRPAAGFDSDSSKGMEEAVTVNTAVGLSEGPVETATVDYAVTGGSAEGSGVDYTLLGSGSLSFEPGETSKTIDVSIVGDDVQEGDETIELSLTSKSSNLKWGANREHTHTIIDDELGGAVYINSYGMKFIRIDAGDFMMGSGSGEWDERPVHKVTISQPFYILETEVTADHYRLFDPNYVGTGYVQNVSWHQAVAFAEWLSGQEGLSYRLPTEAEWEYACRAGTTTPFSSGYSPPSSGTPNPWGVINMHNSPKEWVRDWHGEYSYEDQVDPLGPDQGLARVVRGGGLDESGNYYVRSSNRAGIGPGFAGGYIGFRLVLGELPATPPEPYEAPFVRQGIKANTTVLVQGPDPDEPYFNQRPMLPIPPENTSRTAIDAAGLHPSFRGHNHSPGMEVCPNGDVLMIIYTSYDEYEPGVSLMATRLRFGSNQWDMPNQMFDFPGANDHAPMLWTDNGTLHFFWGCPRLDGAGQYPFQWRSSTDSGATWDEVKFPDFVGPIGGHSRQPINTALRVGNTMYVASDGDGGESVLWKSDDNGQTWYDPMGRTYGRHTTFVLLENGDILGMGGKNTDYDGTGYMPKSISTDGGLTWGAEKTPFSRLGGNQRPCVTRLAGGSLFFCCDFQKSFDCYHPPGITEFGSLVALSDNEGQTWLIKKIPTAFEHECRCWPCRSGTLGYSVARQAPNGVIHVITSMNHPCQHFEMNEEWVLDPDAGGELPPDPGDSGTVNQYQETHPGGATKVTWSAKTCNDGRYLLHGVETWYYESGLKQYEVAYRNGRKVGSETYRGPDGVKRWSWQHDEVNNLSVCIQWWPNGYKRVESHWRYGGKLANGPTFHWHQSGDPKAAWLFVDGVLRGSFPLPKPQRWTAWNPNPADGVKFVAPNAVLSWSPGDAAVWHDVYFGSNFVAVRDGDHSSSAFKRRQNLDANSYDPAGLLDESGTTYYWRIDEISTSETWKGDVWSFATAVGEYALVDDMESYDYGSNRINLTWLDGSKNGTGSIVLVGTEPEPVHGGEQSMAYYYDTSGWGGLFDYYSEIERSYSPRPRDWVGLGVKALTLYFYGDPYNDANATEQMYVGVEDSRGAVGYKEVRYGNYGEDMNDIKVAEWQEWNIDLQDFIDGGVDLTDVNKICLGFGDRFNPTPGGYGLVYFDDIRLYLPRCVPSRGGPVGDVTDDCRVDRIDLEILAGEWLTSGIKADLVEDGNVDFKDYAVLAGSWLDWELWPWP